MIFASRPAIGVLLLPLLLSACSSQNLALSEPQLPKPLIDEIPLRVGVQYSEEMNDFTHHEELLANQEWTVRLGDANKKLYRQIFSSMFSEVLEIEKGDDPQALGIELVIHPRLEAFEFALPQQSRTEAYTVWIRYRLAVFNPEGEELASWPVNAYGKAAADRFEGTKAIQRAASLAMRDAAALVSMRFATETGIGATGLRAEPEQLAAENSESSAMPGVVADQDEEPVAAEAEDESPTDTVSNNERKLVNDHS